MNYQVHKMVSIRSLIHTIVTIFKKMMAKQLEEMLITILDMTHLSVLAK